MKKSKLLLPLVLSIPLITWFAEKDKSADNKPVVSLQWNEVQLTLWEIRSRIPSLSVLLSVEWEIIRATIPPEIIMKDIQSLLLDFPIIHNGEILLKTNISTESRLRWACSICHNYLNFQSEILSDKDIQGYVHHLILNIINIEMEVIPSQEPSTPDNFQKKSSPKYSI